jgi:predicted metal-binding protein
MERMKIKKRSLNFFSKRAIKLGAKDCKVIDVSTVKAAAWVRYKCQYGCDGFNRCLTCPPYSPTPEETKKILADYKKALLIYCPRGAKVDISWIAASLEKEAFFAGYYKAFAMGAGPCRLCASCNIKAGCRHAEQARPSMEACGIDVYATVRKNGFFIETVDSSNCQVNYYSLVLIT